ncbi:MAG TPA: 6,7-dimethyl-8-ribityllumazine synthase, partial [Planctomycetaceae bacterium]|nr:6,7-dimethyl-8-ribityllumazine synthase [Planctomycetaceae bacterium]
MPQHLDVSPIARPDDRFAVVVSKYNSDVTNRLCEAAVTTLGQHGVTDEKILVVPVPGSFEIPVVAEQLARSGRYAAIVCLGAVIQGDTTHHEYINHQVAEGIRTAAQQTGIPVAFGVLTCQSLELALDRAGGKMGNKGHEAAMAALETLATLRAIGKPEQASREASGESESKSES